MNSLRGYQAIQSATCSSGEEKARFPFQHDLFLIMILTSFTLLHFSSRMNVVCSNWKMEKIKTA